MAFHDWWALSIDAHSGVLPASVTQPSACLTCAHDPPGADRVVAVG
jgi:hypothetical protein